MMWWWWWWQSVTYIKEYGNYIILNVTKNDDNDSDDDDDDDMSTVIGILAIQNKGVLLIINQFIPTLLLVSWTLLLFIQTCLILIELLRSKFLGAIFHWGYRVYKYCQSHPRNYYCSKGKLNCRHHKRLMINILYRKGKTVWKTIWTQSL